ncbi:hypothetical protein [Sinorhizobium meliloti]|uniref:hypothetical protein n=1 Tax=Rhizobium meliloti TaxID=382 RepID=UPI000FDB850A|nr:hypothetical protein [Sinorhizobium meliloti]RVG08540.1 hypothetical protein CN234_17305 [Sinorhizobium meliloti]RVG88673.1 hypothetical protein CN219_03640 [Sinorhizobium meliloti]RVI39045.1 hypothetical protein CN197_02595 [Sinorhizobium meliloti]RVI46680.1 hypothetical protein CN196_09445 [Sinorhizobium meliloti]RVJ25682.1 hypothetical protein CN177_13485 [Sinorhizobium meliloti]
MAYVASGLKLLNGGLSNSSMNVWLLDSTDAIATVNTSNYISDGVTRGMAQGDLVWVRTRASLPAGAVSAVHICFVLDVGTGTDGFGVDVTDGLAVTATDTD